MSGPSQNGGIDWLGMPFDKALDWCDRNGLVIRRCGPLDGEAIGYMAIDDAGGVYRPLLQNVRDQMVAQVRGERNHPSVNIWSVENEWLYINTINLYGGLMDEFENDMAKTVSAVMQVDPTRLAMTDGGGSGKDHILPVHGDHYVYTNDPNDYPGLAYTDQPRGASRGRWTWDGKRPRYAGEDYFATGINPADYAWIQGETAFESKVSSHLGMAEVQRMITEGYRWSGAFTAFHLWIGDEGAEFPDKYVANAERVVFVRQWDSAFTGGSTLHRTLGVFNDSRFSDPLTIRWSLVVNGKTTSIGSRTLDVPPGTNQKFDVNLATPLVAARTSGALVLDLLAGGKRVFHDEKTLAFLHDPALPSTPLAVYDPGGTLSKFLADRKTKFRSVTSLASLPADVSTLLVGPDALKESDSTDPALAAFAADGHRVVVLEQQNPLRGAAIPAELEPAQGGGAFAFAEDANHPVFKGLSDTDFRAWGPKSRTYERPYVKATRGVRSLVQVGPRLGQTALCEVPIAKGLLLLCQLQVGHNLSAGGPARNLLANLLSYAATYRRVDRMVYTAVTDAKLDLALGAIGVRCTAAAGPLDALRADAIAFVSATPTNLHVLAANIAKVRAFTADGGALVLNGVTPEGLADYDKLVGVEHMIRPFRREKVGLAFPRDPLAAGISQGDVALSSGERMFNFNEDTFVADDIFSYIVDTDDVAPFAKLPTDYLYNTVNGFVSADSWKYIYSFDLRTGAKPEYTMSFPKPIPLREVTWIGNGFYHKVTRIALSFDGGPDVPFDVLPNTEPQSLTITPPRTAKDVKLSIRAWTQDPGIADVVGIDNIYIKINRPVDWRTKVHSLLNVGGLVRYPQGRGAIVLVNLLFKGKESVPENVGKKRTVLASILRNLGAGFSGGETVVIPGAKGLTYTPISLAGKATAYRNERGWFGDPKRTLAALPTGRQVFGSVPFEVYEFPTSPVPTVVVLAGPGVPGALPDRVDGIKVDQKANALFFLQTARIDAPRDDRERREGKRYELARYVVTYADGSTARIPVYEEIDIDDFRQTAPKDLPEARVAWSKPFAEGPGSATVYLMQWTNPHPERSIATVSLEYGADRRAVPSLIALTCAR
jgi:beta-galactosidase